MQCLHCKAKLTVMDRMINGDFCRPTHRTAHQQSINQLAILRLQEARPGGPAQDCECRACRGLPFLDPELVGARAFQPDMYHERDAEPVTSAC
jgi:hypothetical protein